MLLRLTRFAGCGLAILLGGCATYVPLQCAAPAIHAKGEVEAAAAWSFTNRGEASLTYSPASHLLVRVAGGLKHDARSDSLRLLSRQLELGVGTYWPIGSWLLVGGLAGLGQAHVEARYRNDYQTFSGNSRYHELDARYRTYFGEAYVTAQTGPTTSVGAAYRVTQLRFGEVMDLGAPASIPTILRSEPTVFVRTRPALGATRPVQLQLALAATRTFGYDEATPPADDTDLVRPFRRGKLYVMLGVQFYPHVLWQKEKPRQ